MSQKDKAPDPALPPVQMKALDQGAGLPPSPLMKTEDRGGRIRASHPLLTAPELQSKPSLTPHSPCPCWREAQRGVLPLAKAAQIDHASCLCMLFAVCQSSKLRISRKISEITYEFVLWVHGDVSEHPCSRCLPLQATSAINASHAHLPRLPVHFQQRQGCASQRCPAATCRCWWQEMMSVPRPALTWWVLALACIVFGLAGSLPMLL